MKYQISQKGGYESRHNSNCWKQQEYYGFGISAHSYINNIRYANINSLENYVECINSNEYNKIKQINEMQTIESKSQEYMILKLRTLQGVRIQEYKKIFQENPIYTYRKEIEKLTKQQLIEVDGDNIKLTEKGINFGNLVWQEFI